MELKIDRIQEDGFLEEIQWNHEEIKAYVINKLAQYKELMFTESELNDAKKDRARLREYKKYLEEERKRIKEEIYFV